MVLFFWVCLVATTLGAISGIGGGVIIKPVLDAVSGMPASTLNFLSGCTVLAMSAVSCLRSHNEKPQGRQTILLALGAAAGGVLGGAAFSWVKQLAGNDALVGVVQNVLLTLLTVGVLVYMLNKNSIRTRNITRMTATVLIGFCLGMTGSFLGIGGGPINLVVLYYFFSMKTKSAALSSIYIIFLSQATNLASTIIRQDIPPFAPAVLTLMVFGGVLGGLLGRALSRRMTEKKVEQLFFYLLIVIASICFYNSVRCFLT